jgi:Fuc2NAc and GlcNAc transferase
MIKLLLLVTFLTSAGLTYLLRIYTLKKNIIDVPNTRSSHTLPTPRGGGLSLVLVFLVVLVGFIWTRTLSLWSGGMLFLAGVMVALVGWLDDHGNIHALVRLFVHLLSSVLIVLAFGGLPEFVAFGLTVSLGWLGDLLAVIALAWILNLYNFMDGIDGIAGVEAVTSTLIAGILLYVEFGFSEASGLHFFLSAAVLGFLLWNFPPAKIFMGDVGSGFLGLMLGALALYSASLAPQMLWVWLILLGVFIIDATLTLLRRLLRGDKVYEAHRSHAYQYASRYFNRHKPVTLSVIAINLLWLAPLAYLTVIGWIDGALGLLIAYAPLVWLAWRFKAGAPEDK